MKTCKFCNAELPEGTSVCPACGKDNAEQEITPQGAEPMDTSKDNAEQETVLQSAEAKDCSGGNKNLSVGKTVLAIAAVVAVVILAVGVLLGIKFAGQPQEEEIETVETTLAAEGAAQETVATEPPTVPADGNPDDVTCKGTYTAADEAVIAARDTVVATAGEYELTVGQLQVYYWMEMRNFMSQYGAYASYFGLDINPEPGHPGLRPPGGGLDLAAVFPASGAEHLAQLPGHGRRGGCQRL